MREGKITVQIPARGGSKRVPNKNLREMNGKPMISYAILAALGSSLADRVVVNTDSENIADVARNFGAEVYMRPSELASDTATGDDFTFNFMKAENPQILAMVNPVCPLITSHEIDTALSRFLGNPVADTLISCSETQMQAAVDGRFVNIDPEKELAPSQENPVVQILNWAVAAWDVTTFLERYAEGKGAYIGRSRILHPIDYFSGVKVSVEKDFLFAESLLRVRALN